MNIKISVMASLLSVVSLMGASNIYAQKLVPGLTLINMELDNNLRIYKSTHSLMAA